MFENRIRDEDPVSKSDNISKGKSIIHKTQQMV